MRRKYGRKMIIISVFCIGIIVGSLFSNQLNTPANSHIEEIEQLIESFVYNINMNELVKTDLLFKSLLSYGKQILFIWLFGLFPITILLIGLLVGALGFSYGFTTSFFIIQYNLKGLLICLAAYGIQGILFACIVFLLSIESIQYARKGNKANLKIYAMHLLIASGFVVMISLFEAYIAPILIQQTITIFFE